ncbi:MAG TPA: DUF4157 domain-containing protein [Kofleriaceae bacterium]|nr:DUF4157 domain-containing protein [Kofleriaceae bacterium]
MDRLNTRGPSAQAYERPARDHAAGAQAIADNLDHQLALVRADAAAMATAAAGGDPAGWTVAKQNADQALRQLAHLANAASDASHEATDPAVKTRLASAAQVVEAGQRLVADAPPAPSAAEPTLGCGDALLAALPPEPPPPTWRDADFQSAADRVAAIVTQQMTSADLAAFRALVQRHADHPIARRFHRFGEARRRALWELLDRDDVRRSAREREAAQRRAPVALPVQPTSDTAKSFGDDGTRSDSGPAMRTSAREGAAEARGPDDEAPREALGAAIAARVPGATYGGTGRFHVASGERSITATIQRVQTGASRIRRDASDAAVLEIPTGLDENALATAVATQLRTLQRQPASHDASAGAPLPPDVRADMEHALGADFAAVRIYQDGEAEAVGALAFTRGTRIHFAPGRYDPYSAAGRQLLGHELTHVAQQAQGRVSATTQVHGQATNDDPALEHEADHRGAQAASATGGSTGGARAPATPALGTQPRMTAQSDFATAAPIQRQRDPRQSNQPHIAYRIQITRPMTAAEFKVAVQMQVFGAVVASAWHNVKDAYVPADSPVEILVDEALFHRGRGAANAARGIETDATGNVAGGDARAKAFADAPASDAKTALLAEIDRRYHAASGTAPSAHIRPGELGQLALWRAIRDEVLFQSAYLANLPEPVRAVLRVSIADRTLAPADYDHLFRVAKRIENLPPGQAADYASKVTGQAATLDELEASIDRYRDALAAREHQDQARAEVHNKLVGDGLKDLYTTYRVYRVMPSAARAEGFADKLEPQLRRFGFDSVHAFETYIAKYEQAFEDGAAAITLDLLAKYAGKLHQEAQRYQDQKIVSALHARLGGFRARSQEYDKNAKIESAEAWKAQHDRDAELRRLPGNGGTPEKPLTPARLEARQKMAAAKAGAEAQIKNLSKDYPIFAEDELPTDKRLDKVALANASEAELAGVLQAHIAHRQAAVTEARDQLEGNHALVYKMDKLMPTFAARLGIQPGSLHEQIIHDKMHSDAITKLVTGIAVAVVTVALTVVSLGAATPAVLAASASLGAAGISTYMAYDQYQQYTEDHAIGEAGFANDPSVVWLALAVVGAGVDMASAVNVVAKLGPVAKTLGEAKTLADTDAKLAEFTRAVDQLHAAKQIDDKIATAANKAAAARKSYAAAANQLKADLRGAASGARGALGPFADPTVFRSLVKMAIAKIREGSASLEMFIAELKQARLEAQLGELAPEELVKAKEAWAQAEALSRQAKDPELLDKLLERHPLADAQTLTKLLGHAKVQSSSELLELLDITDSAERLLRMLDLSNVPDGRKLLEWLTKAGGKTTAGRLEDMLKLGAAKSGNVQKMCDVAAGSAAEFEKMADWADILINVTPKPAYAPPPQVAEHGFDGADMPHFLDHTWEHVNIDARVTKSTTFWPRGTAPQQIADELGWALDRLNPPGTSPRLPIPDHPLESGSFKVGSRTVGNDVKIGQFFPLTGDMIPARAMRAIKALIKP